MLKSNEVCHALTKLNDEICSFERSTDREYTLILIPHSFDEDIYISVSGKPTQMGLPWDLLFEAMIARRA